MPVSRVLVGLVFGFAAQLIAPCSLLAQFQQAVYGPGQTSGWTLRGFAQDIGAAEVLLTPNEGNRAGSIFYDQALDPSICNRWIAEFDYRIWGWENSTGTSAPADGIAFCFLNNPPLNAIGGGGIGLPSNPNGIMVVLDQYDNCGGGNPELQIRYGAGAPYSECPPTPQPTLRNAGFVRNQNYQTCRIEYDDGDLEVYINGVLQLTGFYRMNVPGFFGVTASTGGGSDEHSVTNLRITIPDAPDAKADPDTSLCPGATVQLGSPTTPNRTYSWTPGANLDDNTLAQPTFTAPDPGPAPQTYPLALRVTDAGGCFNDDTARVTVNPYAAAPPSDTALACSGATALATLSVQDPGGVSLDWYDQANGGALLTSGLNYTPTPTPAASTTYFVETRNQATNCPSQQRTPVHLIVETRPPQPTVTDTFTCVGSTAPLIPKGPPGVNFNFYLSNGDSLGSCQNVPACQSPPLLSADNFDIYAVSPNGCESNQPANIGVTVAGGPPPDSARVLPSSTLAVCSGSSALVNVACPTGAPGSCPSLTYSLYDVEVGGSALFSQNSSQVSFNTGPLTQDTTFWVGVSDALCFANTRTRVDINVLEEPNPPVVSSPPQVCGASPYTVVIEVDSTQNLPDLSYRVYEPAPSGALVSSSTNGNTITLTSPQPITGSRTWDIEAVSVDNGVFCASASRSPVTVSVTTQPGPPDFPGPPASLIGGNELYNLSVCAGTPTVITPSGPITPGNLTFVWDTVTSTNLDTGASYTVPPLAVGQQYRMLVRSLIPSNCSSNDLTYVFITAVDTIQDPIPQPDTICPNTPAQLAIANAGGVTVQWFANDSTPTPLASGSPWTTGALSGDTSFWVRRDSALCQSNRVEAPVVVDPPTPPNVITIFEGCSGDSAVFTVGNIRAGVNYRWTSDAAGTNLLGTGASYTVNNVTTQDTYYVESHWGPLAAGCPNSPRQELILTPSTPPTAPSLPGTSLCNQSSHVLRPSTPAGASIEWYPNSTTDTVAAFGDTLLLTNLPSDTTVYMAAVNPQGCASNRVAVNVQSVQLTLSVNSPSRCGPGDVTYTATPSDPFAQVEWFTDTLAPAIASGANLTRTINQDDTLWARASQFLALCSSDFVQAIATVDTPPAPPTVGDQQICGNGTASFTASGSGPAYQWYADSQLTSLLATGAAYTTPNLSVSDTFWVAAQENGCNSPPSRAVAEVVASLAAPTVSDTVVCSPGNLDLTASGGAGYTWYNQASGGASLGSGSPFTVNITATDTYWVESTSAACTSSARSRLVVSLLTPDSIQAPAPQPDTTCPNTPAQLGIANDAGVTVNWFATSTSATPVGTGNPLITGNLSADTTFWVSRDSAQCPSARVALPVVVTPPADPLISTTFSGCQGDSAVFRAPAAGAGIAYRWTSDPGGLNLLGRGDSLALGPVTADDTVYAESHWAPLTAGCAGSNRIRATVSPVAPPADPVLSAVTLCNADSLVLRPTVGAGALVNWYPNDSSTAPAQTADTLELTGLGKDTTVYLEAENAQGCTSNRVAAPIEVVNLALNLNEPRRCGPGDVTFNANVSDPTATVRWYPDTLGAPIATGTTFTWNVAATDTIWAQAEHATAACNSPFVQAIATVDTPPTAPTVGDQQICNSGTASFTASGSGPTYRWFADSLLNNFLQNGAAYTTPNLTASDTFWVVARENGCNSDPTRAIAEVVPNLSVPTVSDTFRCDTGDLDLLATGGAGYTWYTLAAGGIALGTGSPFTVNIQATDTFWVESTTPACTSGRARVIVALNTTPAAPTVRDTQRCGPGPLTLEANGGANYQWFSDSAAFPALDTALTYTANISVQDTFWVAAFDGVCPGPQAPLVVSIDTVPAPPTARDTFRCGRGDLDIAASGAPGYRWYSAPTGGSLLDSDSVLNLVNTNTTATYYVAAFDGQCESTRTPVQGEVLPQPPAPVALDRDTCGPASFQLGVSNGNTFEWYDGPDTDTANLVATGDTINTPLLTQDTIFYVFARQGSCLSTPNNLIVRVFQLPAPPTASAVDSSCGPGTVSLQASNGLDYIWYDSPQAPANVVGFGSPVSVTVSATDTFYVITRDGNGCESDSTPVTAVVNPLPTPQIDGDTLVFDTTTNAPYTVAPVSPVGYSWSVDATGGSPTIDRVNSRGDSLFVSFSQGGVDTLYVMATDSSTNCTARDTFPVQVAGCPNPTIGGPASPCAQTAGNIYLTANAPNSSYSWSLTPGSSGRLAAPTNGPNVSYTAASGFDTLVVAETDAVSGCTVTDSFFITPLPRPTAPSLPPGGICPGDTLTLAAPAGFASYTWLRANGAAIPGANQDTYAISQPETLLLRVANANGCADTTAPIGVQSTTPPTAPNLQGGDHCPGGDFVLRAGPGFSNYQWLRNGAATGVGGPGDSTYQASGPNSFQVVVFDGTCADTSDPAAVGIHPRPQVQMLGRDTAYTGSANSVYEVDPDSNYQVQWSVSGAISLLGNPNVPRILAQYPNSPGTAVITVRVTDPATGCDTLLQKTVVILECPTPDISLGTSYCLGVDSLAVSTPGWGNLYQWSLLGGGSLVGGDNPLNYYTPSNLGTDTLVLAETDPNTNCTLRDTAFVNILATPNVVAVLAVDSLCQSDSLRIRIPQPQAGVSYQLLAPGGAAVGSPQSGADTLRFNLGPGQLTNGANTFLVQATLTATGCDTVLDTVSLFQKPLPNLPQVADTQLCQGDTLRLRVQNPQAGAVYRWFESETDTTNPLAGGPVFTIPQAQDTQQVYLRVTLEGCTNGPVPAQAAVVPLPTAPPDFTFVKCEGEPDVIPVANAPTGPAFQYSWFANDSTPTPAFTAASPDFTTGPWVNDTVIYLRIDQAGCTDSSRTAVTVNNTQAPPIVDLPDQAVCEGQEVTLSLPPLPDIVYWWYTDTTEEHFLEADSYTYTVTSTQTFYFQSLEGSCGSERFGTTTVTMIPGPAANLGIDPPAPETGDNVTFQVGGLGPSGLVWDLGAPDAGNVSGNPVDYTYEQAGVYEITLVVNDSVSGCSDTLVEELVVTEAPDLPRFNNIFSPNADGLNDLFLPFEVFNPTNWQMRIFDRQGVLMATLQNHTEGWDGTNQRGEPVPDGVYFYQVNATLNTGQTIERSGTVTLMR